VVRASSAAVLLADTHKRITGAPLQSADFDALAAQAITTTLPAEPHQPPTHDE
jgi:hypothetical protein